MRLWVRWGLALSPLLVASAMVGGCGSTCLDPKPDLPCGEADSAPAVNGGGGGGKSSGSGGAPSSGGSTGIITSPGGASFGGASTGAAGEGGAAPAGEALSLIHI